MDIVNLVPIILALFLGFGITFIFLSSRRNKQEKDFPISKPRRVEHDASIYFDTNGQLVVRNLPPEYKLLFDNINQNLESMGVSSLTEKETKMVLKALPDLGKLSVSKTSTSTSSPINQVSNTQEISKLQSQIRNLSEKYKQLENVNKELRNENSRLLSDLNEAKSGGSPQQGTELQTLNSSNFFVTRRKEKLKSQLLNQTLPEDNIPTSFNDDAPPAPPPPPPTNQESPKITIRKNTKEKSANELEKSKSETKLSQVRLELLEAIRNPKALKHVTEEEKVNKRKVMLEDKSIGAVIARALVKRRNVIKTDNENETSNLDDLDKWI